MNLADVQAVIDSAKVRDDGKLEEFIRTICPEANEDDVADAASVAVEVVEAVPLLLARAAQAAEQRGLKVVVMPLLEHAARVLRQHPIDLIPEMTQGMAGLLDDTYLALRILENPEPRTRAAVRRRLPGASSLSQEARGDGDHKKTGCGVRSSRFRTCPRM